MSFILIVVTRRLGLLERNSFALSIFGLPRRLFLLVFFRRGGCIVFYLDKL